MCTSLGLLETLQASLVIFKLVLLYQKKTSCYTALCSFFVVLCVFPYFPFKWKLTLAGLLKAESLTMRNPVLRIDWSLYLGRTAAPCSMWCTCFTTSLIHILHCLIPSCSYLYLYLLFSAKKLGVSYNCCLNNVDLTESGAESQPRGANVE